MRDLYALVEVVAVSPMSVLIIGETGVGKDVLANQIHEASPRRHRPIVCVNCAALPANIVESELFGYKRGAFTGAQVHKDGLIVSAHKGTLFLDEIGDLPLDVQAKLLRVLESGEVLPLGALTPVRVEFRLIAATHRDLRGMVKEGSFRKDFYYRINGVTLKIPPLRERPEDIPVLVDHFTHAWCAEHGTRLRRFSEEALAKLVAHNWPGNVRELKNLVQRALLLTDELVVNASMLPMETMLPRSLSQPPMLPAFASPPPPRLRAGRASAEERREAVIVALEKARGNQVQAAQLLGISRRTLINWLDVLEVPRPRKKQ